LTKLESEDNSTAGQPTIEVNEQENVAEMNGTAVSDLLSQEHLLPETSAPSDLSFSQSSTDLPSLIDHCLTDSVAAEIDIMTSPRHMESADDNDFHSAMSTPPIHPDSDSDIVLLPSNECYANGIFPDKIDDLFVSQSPSNDQSVLDSLMSNCHEIADCPDDNTDVICKQLDMDVNNLLRLNESEASKSDNKKDSCEGDCSKTVDCPIGTSDVISQQLDMDVNNLLQLNDGGTSKSYNEKESRVGVHYSRCEVVASSDCNAVESLKYITDVAGTCELKTKTVSSLKSGLSSSQDVNAAGHLECDTAPSFALSVHECTVEPSSDRDEELVSPLFIVQFEGEMISECKPQLLTEGSEAKITPKTEDIEPVLPSDMLCDDSKTDADFVTDLSSAVISSNVRTEDLLLDDKQIVDTDVKVDITCPPLSDVACNKDSVNGASDEFKPFPNITTTTDDSLINIASLGNADGSRMYGSFPSKVKGTSSVPCIASFSSSNSDDWSFDESWLPDWKLQTNAVVRLNRLVLPPGQYSPVLKYTAASEDKGISSKSQSHIGLTVASVQPLLSKMTSEEAEIESKSLATNASVKSPPVMSERSSFSALVEDMPVKQLEQASVKSPVVSERSSFSALMEDMPMKQLEQASVKSPVVSERSSFSALMEDVPMKQEEQASVKSPVMSDRSSFSALVEDMPTKQEEQASVKIMSERSSFSALMEDTPMKQEEQVKINRQPSSVIAVPLSSSSSSSLSSSGTKALSSTVASVSSQQKGVSFADYCNNPRFQPVVQLVRLPLEFFRMLQQTSQPVASSSLSVSDLQKRFVRNYQKFNAEIIFMSLF